MTPIEDAEKRATRAEARADIRGRAVAIYQRRARAAEEEAREWRSEAEWLHKIESDDLKEADLRAIEAEAAARRAHDRAYKADLAWEDEKRRADQAEAQIQSIQDLIDEAYTAGDPAVTTTRLQWVIDSRDGSPTRECGRGPCCLGDGHEGNCRT